MSRSRWSNGAPFNKNEEGQGLEPRETLALAAFLLQRDRAGEDTRAYTVKT
jgi:hypothetical protein